MYDDSDIPSGIFWNCITEYAITSLRPPSRDHEIEVAVRFVGFGSLIFHNHKYVPNHRVTLNTYLNTVKVFADGGSLE